MSNHTKDTMKISYALIIVFILLVASISPLGDLMRSMYEDKLEDEIVSTINRITLFGLGGLLMILGLVLSFLTWKKINDKKLKRFLLMTGLSAGLFLVLSILHNVFYAISEIFSDKAIIKGIMSVMEVTAFLGAVCLVPIIFLVCVIGTLVAYKKIGEKSST